jgi:peptidyl-prolyl cis-trans isomerase C
MAQDTRIRLLVAVALVAAGIAGCDKITPAHKGASEKKAAYEVKGTVIAKVSGYPITLEDLNQEIEEYNRNAEQQQQPSLKITTADKKIEYLKNTMVRRVLLYQEALSRGYDKRDEIVNALEKTRQTLLVLDLVKKETDGLDVASKEIEDFYNQFKDQMKSPEERHLREIVVPTEQAATEVYIQLLRGGDFAALAQERSVTASRDKGGDLGWVKKGTRQSEPFDNAAFSPSLEVGKLSSPFKGPDGYTILKLDEKKGGKAPEMSEVWDQIKNLITFSKQEKKINELVGKLSEKSNVQVFESDIR